MVERDKSREDTNWTTTKAKRVFLHKITSDEEV